MKLATSIDCMMTKLVSTYSYTATTRTQDFAHCPQNPAICSKLLFSNLRSLNCSQWAAMWCATIQVQNKRKGLNSRSHLICWYIVLRHPCLLVTEDANHTNWHTLSWPWETHILYDTPKPTPQLYVLLQTTPDLLCSKHQVRLPLAKDHQVHLSSIGVSISMHLFVLDMCV
jgi:hypothetical protein